MEKKIIKVSNCFNCPYSKKRPLAFSYVYICKKANNKEIREINNKNFPSFCPLGDIKAEEPKLSSKKLEYILNETKKNFKTDKVEVIESENNTKKVIVSKDIVNDDFVITIEKVKKHFYKYY